MQTQTLLITGISGHLGRRAAAHCLASHRNAPHYRNLIGLTRHGARVADLAASGIDIRHGDFDAPATLAGAMAGAHRMLLISTGADCAGERRVQQHRRAIDAAHDAGVAHIAYTSFLAAPDSGLRALAADHVRTEAALRDSGIAHTVLRNAFYMEMLLTTLPAALASGELRTLDAHAGVAYIARDDCAVAAATALLHGTGNTVLDITGATAITAFDLADAVRQVFGVALKVVECSADDRLARLAHGGVPAPMARMLVQIEQALAQGDMAHVSGDFAHLCGREPLGIAPFLDANRAALTARPSHLHT